MTSNISVIANFAPDVVTYNLTYNAGTNGTISGTSPQTVNYGGSGTAVTPVPNTGYHFVNWSDGSTANPRTDSNVTSNISVTANFAISTFTLTYTAGSNGTITGTSPQTVNYEGSGTQVTAVPDSGYHFVNWSDGSTANPRTDTNVTSNISVTANFDSNPIPYYYLDISSGSGGTVTTPGIGNFGPYTSGQQVSLTANNNPNYHFINWSGDTSTIANPNTANTTITMNGNYTIQANFAINTYTLTYTAGTGGSISGISPQTVNHGGSGAQVTAAANTGYHFLNWSDSSTANPRTDSNVTSDISVTANFVQLPTVIINISCSGTPGDTTPPAAVIDLAATNPTYNSITLTWTAPGDDDNTGTATQYDIRYSTSTIDESNWASAEQVSGEPAPLAAGSNQNCVVTNLSPATSYYFALKTADEVPNWSGILNVPTGTTLALPIVIINIDCE